MSTTDIAQVKALCAAWRQKNGYVGRGGVVVVFEGRVCGWTNALRDPDHWEPGCIGVEEDGACSVTQGGNAQSGAQRWAPFH